MSTGVARYFDDGRAEFAGWTPLLWDPHGEALVEAAAPAPGERVLDACCGAGSSALSAARAVGPLGRVDGIDLSDGLLATARARAAAAGLTNVEFTCADVTGWRNGDYDVVLCGFGVFFLPNMDADTERLIGLLGRDGRFAMTCWPTGSLDAVFRPFFAAIGEHCPEVLAAPKPPFTANSERLQTEQSVADWLASRGLTDIRVERREQDIPIDADRGWDFLHSGPVRSMLGDVDADTVERIRQSFRTMVTAEGIDTLRAPSLAATGAVER